MVYYRLGKLFGFTPKQIDKLPMRYIEFIGYVAEEEQKIAQRKQKKW